MQHPSDPHLPALRDALALQKANRLEEAERAYRQIVLSAPAHVTALHLLGVVLSQTGRATEGVDFLRQSITLQPADSLAWNNLAKALLSLDQLEAALDACEQALALQPTYGMAHSNRGYVLQALKKYDLALRAFDQALSFLPGHVDSMVGRSRVLMDMGRPLEALACAEQAILQSPGDYEAHRLLAAALRALRRYPQAAVAIQKMLQLQPDQKAALGALADVKMAACDWAGLPELVNIIQEQLMQGVWIPTPFVLLGCFDSADVLLHSARLYTQAVAPVQAALPLVASNHARIRVAYLSADFHTHATSYLMAELFELHDRRQFEVVGVSFGPDEHSALSQRIEHAFDRFVRVGTMNDHEVAALLVRENIDIAVDLKGFTQHSRPGIFAYKPAPVIVNYLGYPGTLGAEYYDYIVGDRVVTPLENAAHFSEKIVQLPHSYQVNDRKREIAPQIPSRSDAGLPESGFIFACFNASYKITPAVFGIWMRLLQRVEGSVIWLLADNPHAMENLLREAEKHGLARSRLVFAQRQSLPQHLARHRLADLFLDTLPVNAHTTASDALWAGLPVLTCMGESFAARVAASLLTAIGLTELITNSLVEYEATALQLANNPDGLLKIRHKLHLQRDTSPLFDTPLFTAHLEQAYLQMFERHQRGLPPTSMVIAPLA